MSNNNSANTGGQNMNISRRNWMQAIGVGAVGTSIVDTAGAVNSEDSVEVVISRSSDGDHETTEVPTEWEDHREHAEKINDEMQAERMSQKGVMKVSLTSSEETYGGKSGFKIEVGVKSDIFEGTIPDSKDGIPVETVEATPISYGSCGITLDTNDIPGAVAIENEDDDDGDCSMSFGSTGFKVSYEKEHYMLTAAHIYGGGSDPCPSGIQTNDSAFHHGDYFGNVNHWTEEEDWLLISTNHDETFDDKLWDPDQQKRVDAVAWYTDTGVANLISDNTEIYKCGITLGKESGQVTDKSISSGWDCVDWDGEGVETDTDFAEGDSGGPVWSDDNNDDAVIVTHNCQLAGDDIGTASCHPIGDCSASNLNIEDALRGTAFYHLHDKYGMQVVD